MNEDEGNRLLLGLIAAQCLSLGNKCIYAQLAKRTAIKLLNGYVFNHSNCLDNFKYIPPNQLDTTDFPKDSVALIDEVACIPTSIFLNASERAPVFVCATTEIGYEGLV